MKRILALTLLLMLLLSLSACGEPVAEVVVVTEVPVMMEPVQPEPTLTPEPEPTPEPTPIPIQPELPEVVDEALNAVLDSITADVQPGTAGSSLRAAQCAAKLLAWGESSNLTDDEIYSAVGSWLDMQDDEHLLLFFDCFYPVYNASYDLRSENGEALLRDAGMATEAWPYSDKAAHAVEMVYYGCGLR